MAAAARDGIELDGEQRDLVKHLGSLGRRVSDAGIRRSARRGMYVHGSAGRGKTWLADAFFDAVPLTQKRRVHFHGFFDDLHRQIQAFRAEDNAFECAVDAIVGDARLLLFDELHVHDAGDARLLTRLLDSVFRRDVLVLATSNYAPPDLLPNPIWHHTFLPGIALLEEHLDVHHLIGAVDYRAQQHDHVAGFASGAWTKASRSGVKDHTVLTVSGRDFAVISVERSRLTATFEQLCTYATSTMEFLHWARTYPQWTITNIPAFGEADIQAQQRFINLVDVLVDTDVAVTFVADVDRDTFVSAATDRPDAFRMASRLQLLRSEPGEAA